MLTKGTIVTCSEDIKYALNKLEQIIPSGTQLEVYKDDGTDCRILYEGKTYNVKSNTLTEV